MFRNTAMAANPTFKLILGLGLCTLGGAMLYVYYKNRDEDEGEDQHAQKKPSNGIQKQKQQKKKTEKETTINIVVANEHIPLIVGRSGSNLSSIEEKTCTKIRLRDKNGTHKFCDITGYPDGVKDARAMLLKEIERSPIVKEEIFVPQSVCGKIMGRCGEAMQEICRISLAKVAVDSGGNSGGVDKRRIVITGNQQQVNIARKMVEDKIAEDEELQRTVEELEQNREPRRSPANSLNSSMYSSQNSLSSHLHPRDKMLAAKTDEKAMEVYVSAIASPSKFWVQLIGPQAKKLDDMVQSMTEYYSESINRAKHEIIEPYLGQIVAAIFKYDGKWYRAEIVGILPNQYNPSEVVLDLYFVDYGDSEYVAPHEVFELRTDFLTLRFQAVECFLANIKPPNANSDSETWDAQSIQKFEELTQVANWKKLISRVVTYKERPKMANGASQNSVAREGAPIPGIELFDLTEGVEVNIGHMLISHGFALPAEQTRPRSPLYNGSSPDTSMYQQKPLTPQSPKSPPQTGISELTNDSTALKKELNSNIPTSAEDALMAQQMQHLKKNNNLYLNGNGSSAAKVNNADLFNGNFKPSATTTATAMTSNGKHSLNGNLSR